MNPSPIIEVDFEGKVEYVNPTAKARFTDIETLGLNHPLFANWKNITKAFNEKTANSLIDEVKIGEDWYLQNYYKVPNTQRIRIYGLNVTERKRLEEALRESEQRWSTTLASIGDAVISTDVSGKILFINGEAEKLTGWSMSKASQKPVKEVFKIINEQTRLAVENPIDRVLKEVTSNRWALEKLSQAAKASSTRQLSKHWQRSNRIEPVRTSYSSSWTRWMPWNFLPSWLEYEPVNLKTLILISY